MTHRRPRSRGVPSSASATAAQLIPVDEIESGRALAFLVLQRHDTTGRYVADLLSELDTSHTLTPQERSLAFDVAAGTLRRRRTIDVLLSSQVRRSRADVEPDLWRILQTGVQQLCFGRAPDHAAVDETVELTRSLKCARWSGFVNGVLRNVTRLLTDQLATEPAQNCLPLTRGTYRQLHTDVFSCPLTRPVEYIGEAFSLPRAIARRWHQWMTRAELLATAFHCLNPPVTGMRVNLLRTSVSDVVGMLHSAGVVTEPGMLDESLRLQSAGRIEALPGFSEGLWSIQDESAMNAARMLDPKPGELILDLCAAPGGKAAHLAELSGDRATIYATDVSEDRLKLVESGVRRLQLSSVLPQLINRDGSGLPDVEFDAALVDVPCSNTGVLSRRPEARWRFREEELSNLTQLQTQLLMTAFDRLRPGGRLVYSTCSIEPEETTELIRNVVSAVHAMTLRKEIRSLPGQPADGAYCALIVREPVPVAGNRAVSDSGSLS